MYHHIEFTDFPYNLQKYTICCVSIWKKPAPSCRFKCQWGNCDVCCEAKRWEFLSRCGCSEAKPFHWFVQMIEHSIMESCLLHSVLAEMMECWVLQHGATHASHLVPVLCFSDDHRCNSAIHHEAFAKQGQVDKALELMEDWGQYLSWLIAGFQTCTRDQESRWMCSGGLTWFKLS